MAMSLNALHDKIKTCSDCGEALRWFALCEAEAALYRLTPEEKDDKVIRQVLTNIHQLIEEVLY